MKTEIQDHPYGKAVATLIEEFGRLPGIGRKSAERLANYVLACSVDEANRLADAIRNVKTSVRRCSLCFNLTEDTCAGSVAILGENSMSFALLNNRKTWSLWSHPEPSRACIMFSVDELRRSKVSARRI